MEPRPVAPEDIAQEKKKYTSSEIDTRTSRVDDRLHSREKEGFLAWRSRKNLSKEHADVQEDWHHEPLTQNQSSGIPVLSTAAFVLSFVGLCFAGYMGWSMLSTAPAAPTEPTVTVAVTGAQTMQSGGMLELQVVVSNTLSIPLELAELVVTYPPGTFSPEDGTQALTESRQPLGSIAARSVRRGTIKTVVFGVQGEEKKIQFSLEYRAQGQSNIYQAQTTHGYAISTSPFAVTTEGLKEVVSGQVSDIVVAITSQADTTVHDTIVSVAYPFGFAVKEVTPEETPAVESGANENTHLWALGDFAPGETKKIYLRGAYVGEDGDTKLFKISAGTRAKKDVARVDTVLATGTHTALVKRPFLSTTLLLNGQSPATFAFTPGEAVRATLEWKNTLAVPLTNVSLGVVVGGDALNKTGIKVSRGFYRSTDSQVLWDGTTKQETFRTIAPGARGVEEFTIQTLGDVRLQDITNPSVTFSIRAAGKRTGETGVPETLESTTTAEVPVRTKTTFTANATYFTSPFPQSGPLPPKVDTETVYAIEWRVGSSSSDIDGGVVVGVLPPNVRFRNVRTPIAENLSYDAVTRTVTWYVGRVQRGVAEGGRPLRGVTFAVGLIPSASQLRDEPDIITNQTFTGTDTYTRAPVQATTENINTILDEEGFDERMAGVVE